MQISLTFLGAAQNVTGSCFLVNLNETTVLVECGLYQERHLRARNWDPFPIPPASASAVLLTHAHLDHCGLLPKLVREGFRGRIYCTAATAEIAQIVLLDSAHLQQEDAEVKHKRHQREGRKGLYPEMPLYTVEDVNRCLPVFSSVAYEQPIALGDGAEATFYNAGHILGSSMIKLRLRWNGSQRTILFSGDIGRPDKPLVCDPTVFAEADYILIESTYGDRQHKSSGDVKNQIADVINSTKQSGGNIIVPSFAIERSQEILYYLNELLLADAIPHIMVFLDSPMAASVTEVFRQHPELFDKQMAEHLAHGESPFNFPGLKIIRTTEESKAINHIKGTVMVIAGSGMCTGGRIKHHLVNNISRPESTIMFVGYQAQGTLGRQIIDGAQSVRIFGRMHPVKARVVRINGFSSHADKHELLGWLSRLKRPPRRLFVVHGEAQSAAGFAEYLRESTGWNVSVPAYKDTAVLD